MNGSVTYGPLGRLLSGLSYLSMLIVAAQLGGLIQLLPPKVSAIVLAVGATLTVLSERIQGGASKPEVREAAATSDSSNLLEQANE